MCEVSQRNASVRKAVAARDKLKVLKTSWSHPSLARAGLVLPGGFKGFLLVLSSPREGSHYFSLGEALLAVFSY